MEHSCAPLPLLFVACVDYLAMLGINREDFRSIFSSRGARSLRRACRPDLANTSTTTVSPIISISPTSTSTVIVD